MAAQLETLRDKLVGRKVVLELVLELHLQVGPISSRGSVALRVDPRLGKSTDRATRPRGSNVPCLLDPLVDLLPGSDLEEEEEVMEVIAKTAAAGTAALHLGSSLEVMIEATTTTAATVADTVDKAATDKVEVEATDKEVMAHPLEAPLRGCNRNRTQDTAPQAWTAMALLLLRLRHQVASLLLRRPAIFPRLLHPHRNSGSKGSIRGRTMWQQFAMV